MYGFEVISYDVVSVIEDSHKLVPKPQWMQSNLTPYIWAYFRQGGVQEFGLFSRGGGYPILDVIFRNIWSIFVKIICGAVRGETMWVLIFRCIFKL